MNLIPIQTTQEDLQIVSGRDLHQFLEINTRYNDWFKRMCEYGFIENVDYTPITQKRVTAQGNATKQTDHNLSIEMAKQLCMLARNEKGKQAREYFIQVEREWNSPEKIQRSVGGQWILYKNQMGKGYTKSETFTFTRSDGRLDSKITTKWTQKGRLMIHEIMKSRGIDAVCKDIA